MERVNRTRGKACGDGKMSRKVDSSIEVARLVRFRYWQGLDDADLNIVVNLGMNKASF